MERKKVMQKVQRLETKNKDATKKTKKVVVKKKKILKETRVIEGLLGDKDYSSYSYRSKF